MSNNSDHKTSFDNYHKQLSPGVHYDCSNKLRHAVLTQHINISRYDICAVFAILFLLTVGVCVCVRLRVRAQISVYIHP